MRVQLYDMQAIYRMYSTDLQRNAQQHNSLLIALARLVKQVGCYVDERVVCQDSAWLGQP